MSDERTTPEGETESPTLVSLPGGAPLRGRGGGPVRALLLANFAPSTVRTISDLLDVQPGPSPTVWAVPDKRLQAGEPIADAALVVRDYESLGLRTVDTLVRAYRPKVLLATIRSLRSLDELRRICEVPFVAREHPLGPSELVPVVRQICRL